VYATHEVAEHACFYQPLGGIIDRREYGIPGKSKDYGIGMKRSKTAEGQIRSQVGLPERHLQRNQGANQHPYEAPDGSSQDKKTDNAIVEVYEFTAAFPVHVGKGRFHEWCGGFSSSPIICFFRVAWQVMSGACVQARETRAGS